MEREIETLMQKHFFTDRMDVLKMGVVIYHGVRGHARAGYTSPLCGCGRHVSASGAARSTCETEIQLDAT